MEIQPVGNNGQIQSFDDPDKFLEQIDTLLKLGYKFSVSVAKESIDLFEKLNQLFEKHKIEGPVNFPVILRTAGLASTTTLVYLG